MSLRFFHLIKSEKPVVVDFFAEWCEPCRQIPGILKDVKAELKRNVRVIKVDVDKNPLIASKYRIQNLPTVIIFKNSEPCHVAVGVEQAYRLKAFLKAQTGL